VPAYPRFALQHSPAGERPKRFLFAACTLLLAITVPLLAACGGDDKKDDLANEPGPRFLVTGARGLSERAGQREKLIVQFDDGAFILDPAISADGKKLAFSVQHPATADSKGNVDFGSDLWLADRNGSNRKEILRHSAPGEFISRPNWLPNGKQLVFDVRGTKQDGSPDLRVESLDLDTMQRQRLAADAVEPAMNPDGKTVAYVYINPRTQHEQLMTADLTTGKSTPLTGSDASQVYNIELAWSPDGEWLAWGAADPNVKAPSIGGGLRSAVAMTHPFLQDVWVIKRDGTSFKRLADIGESQPSLAWSADGQYVYAMGATNFWRIKLSDGSKEIIGAGSPNGQLRVASK
jgi:Tol biopolymer transport system component